MSALTYTHLLSLFDDTVFTAQPALKQDEWNELAQQLPRSFFDCYIFNT